MRPFEEPHAFASNNWQVKEGHGVLFSKAASTPAVPVLLSRLLRRMEKRPSLLSAAVAKAMAGLL